MKPWSPSGTNSVPTSGGTPKLATNNASAIAITDLRCDERPVEDRAVDAMQPLDAALDATPSARPSQRARRKRPSRRIAPDRREHRVEREADEQADQHGDGDGDAELEEEAPDDALHERDRHEHRDDRERRRHHREADLVGRLLRRLPVRLAHREVAHDVLAHDDRVVDQQADAQRQRHQREEVQREPERVQRDERRDHRDRKREAGDDRAAPAVQEQEHDQHGQQRALDDRLLDAVDALLDRLGRRVDDLHLDVGRQPILERGHRVADVAARSRRCSRPAPCGCRS